jgi:hypothetical protein
MSLDEGNQSLAYHAITQPLGQLGVGIPLVQLDVG